MLVTLQKGSITQSAPKQLKGVDYCVIYTDDGSICMVLQTLNRSNVLAITAKDPKFEEVLEMLGLAKNETEIEELKV